MTPLSYFAGFEWIKALQALTASPEFIHALANYPGLQQSNLELCQHLDTIAVLCESSSKYKYIPMTFTPELKNYKNIGDAFLYNISTDEVFYRMQYKFRYCNINPFSHSYIINKYQNYKPNVDVIHLGFSNHTVMAKQFIPDEMRDFFVKTALDADWFNTHIPKCLKNVEAINQIKPSPSLYKYVIYEKILK